MDTDGEDEAEENEGEDLTNEDMLGWYEPQEPTPAAAPDTRGDDMDAGDEDAAAATNQEHDLIHAGALEGAVESLDAEAQLEDAAAEAALADEERDALRETVE